MTMVIGMFMNLMTRYWSFFYIYLIQSYKIPLRINLISVNYWLGCLRKIYIVGGTIWDQTDGCAKQYKCSVAYYKMYVLSKSYQTVIDRAADSSDHGKDILDDFNAFQKQYLATCLRMRSRPEKDNIDSNIMRVDAMTENGEV